MRYWPWIILSTNPSARLSAASFSALPRIRMNPLRSPLRGSVDHGLEALDSALTLKGPVVLQACCRRAKVPCCSRPGLGHGSHRITIAASAIVMLLCNDERPPPVVGSRSLRLGEIFLHTQLLSPGCEGGEVPEQGSGTGSEAEWPAPSPSNRGRGRATGAEAERPVPGPRQHQRRLIRA